MLSPPTSTSSMMKSDFSPVNGGASYPSSPSGPVTGHLHQQQQQQQHFNGNGHNVNDMCMAMARRFELIVDSVKNNEDIPNDPGKMFIGGLSWQTTPESIREYFSHFGELAEVMVMKDPATRRSRGFGFITFSDPSSVEKVLKFPVHQLDGKVVEPKVAVPRKTNPKLVMRTKKIFVGGLSATTSLEDVRAYFEQFSKVKDAMLAYDKVTNRHRGFGFVTFDNDEVVDKICEIHFHEINGKMVESKKAMPKEPRGPAMNGNGGSGGSSSHYFPSNYYSNYASPQYNNSFSPSAQRQSSGYAGGMKTGHNSPAGPYFNNGNSYLNEQHHPPSRHNNGNTFFSHRRNNLDTYDDGDSYNMMMDSGSNDAEFPPLNYNAPASPAPSNPKHADLAPANGLMSF